MPPLISRYVGIPDAYLRIWNLGSNPKVPKRILHPAPYTPPPCSVRVGTPHGLGS